MALDNITILGYAWPKWMPPRRDSREIWLLNQGYRLPWVDMNGVDRWFEMHRREKLETDKHASTHIPWLKEEHPFPIFMTQRWEDFPSSVEYPLDEVSNELLGGFIRRIPSTTSPDDEAAQRYYFSCSFTYMLALAIYMRPACITLSGVEMLAPREAWMEAPGVEFWLGIAVANGIYVRLPDQSRLLWRHLYGYEKRLPPAWLSDDVAREVFFDDQRMERDTSIPSFYNVNYEKQTTVPNKDYGPRGSTDSGGVK
ncbi:MAG: hypothetical protein A2W28_00115 [Gammaproteobacteria bacterium RBG_16_51_14]|nr:MAG: hypothetical protein A2W28_00115 [Gammaproteobacteria bacterium RBG_16_51_14]